MTHHECFDNGDRRSGQAQEVWKGHLKYHEKHKNALNKGNIDIFE